MSSLAALHPTFTRVTMTYDRIRAVASRLLEHAKVFPQRPGYHESDPDWVRNFNRLTARSPLGAQHMFLNFLLSDSDFNKVVPQADHSLLELAVSATEIRANLYIIEVGPVAPDVEHSQTPLFDADWPKTGIYRYHINPQGQVEFLLRKRPGYSFDARDVIYSYGRDLSPAEQEQVQAVSRL